MVHVFVDQENVSNKHLKHCFEKLESKYKQKDIIVDIVAVNFKYVNTNLFVRFTKSFTGKNSSDTVLTALIAKAVYEEKSTNHFIIISSDKDFIPAIKLITDKQKKCTLLIEKGSTEQHLVEYGVNLSYCNVINSCKDFKIISGYIICSCLNNISAPNIKVPANYYNKHIDLLQGAIIVDDFGNWYKIPFINGEHLKKFRHIKELNPNNFSPSEKEIDIIKRSNLKYKQYKIYFYTEDELWDMV